MRTALTSAALAALTGLAVPTAGRTGPLVVEAEDGQVVNALCGDSATETMGPDDSAGASGGRIMFFPAARCSARYDPAALAGAAGLRSIVSVTFWMTGAGSGPDDVHCGHVELSGGVVGSSEPRCVRPGERVTVPVRATPRVGPWTATWVTDDETPSFVNGFVDYFTGR